MAAKKKTTKKKARAKGGAARSKKPAGKSAKAPRRFLGREELRSAGQKIREVEVEKLGGFVHVGRLSGRLVIKFQDLLSVQRRSEEAGEELSDEFKTDVAYAMFDLLQDALVDEEGGKLYATRDDLLELPLENLVVIAEAIMTHALSVQSPGGNP